MNTYLVVGSNYISQSEILASKLSAKVLDIHRKIFPDGELYVRIKEPEKIRGKVVIVANTLYPRQNDSLVETLLLIDAVRHNNPSKIILLIPYIAYSRQDKIFLPGEPISAEVVLKTLSHIGGDCLITIDIHSPKSLNSFNGIAENILVSDILVEKALRYVEKPIILAPDKGAIGRAKYAAEKHGLEYDYLVKQRDRITGEITMIPREITVENRDVIIVDDIISTGGTIVTAAKLMLKQGARRVVLATSHGLFIGNALEKIKASGIVKLLIANTLGTKPNDPLIEVVDVTHRIADAITKLIGKSG